VGSELGGRDRLIYVIGRIVYLRSYVADPAQRSRASTSMLPILALLIGGLIGAIRNL
jgi:hypothetical protein